MKALGVGWTVQDAMYFGGEETVRQVRSEGSMAGPPVDDGEAHWRSSRSRHRRASRVSTYNPFTVLQWLLDGKNVGGLAMRGPEETPSRAEALRFYTLGSAWFAHDDDVRGSLEVGKLADLAVLSKDYMTVPVHEVGTIESLLTMIGGKVVYAAGALATFERK